MTYIEDKDTYVSKILCSFCIYADAYQLTSELKRNSNRGAYEGRHDVHVRTFQKAAKGVYGGGDMLRPRTKSKSGAYSLLLKPSSLLPLTLKAAVGLLVCIVLF